MSGDTFPELESARMDAESRMQNAWNAQRMARDATRIVHVLAHEKATLDRRAILGELTDDRAGRLSAPLGVRHG